MRCIVAGSRDIVDYGIVKKAIESAPFFAEITEIVSGGARGVDALAELYADNHAVSCRVFPANWDRYGIAAGMMRNRQMLAYAAENSGPALVAVWDGRSRGTASMINSSRRAGLRIWIWLTEEDRGVEGLEQ